MFLNTDPRNAGIQNGSRRIMSLIETHQYLEDKADGVDVNDFGV